MLEFELDSKDELLKKKDFMLKESRERDQKQKMELRELQNRIRVLENVRTKTGVKRAADENLEVSTCILGNADPCCLGRSVKLTCL